MDEQQKFRLVQFRPGNLLRHLTARGSNPSAIAKRDLGQYYFLLMRTLAEMHFSFSEALIIAEATKRSDIDIEDIQSYESLACPVLNCDCDNYKELVRMLSNDTQVIIEHSYELHLTELIEKVNFLPLFQYIAVIDAVAQYDILCKRYSGDPYGVEDIDSNFNMFSGNRLAWYLHKSGLWNPDFGDLEIYGLGKQSWYQAVSALVLPERSTAGSGTAEYR